MSNTAYCVRAKSGTYAQAFWTGEYAAIGWMRICRTSRKRILNLSVRFMTLCMPLMGICAGDRISAR
jgi:hypothetical protein